MDRKIRVGAVSYLNTKPLLYGIEHATLSDEISLVTEYPAKIADRLLRDEIDIGLVPVAIIHQLPEYHINTNFCIGCDGPVASVCIFSEVPISEVEMLLLDYQSRTSVALAKILLSEYWKREPVLQQAENDFISRIKGTTAAVVIGDRALHQRSVSPYVYDLGEAWKALTGLPFVFAAWISNKKLDEGWVERFDAANKAGVEHIREVLEENPYPEFDLKEYYTRYLSYELTAEKRAGLNLFLKMLKEKEMELMVDR